MAGKRHHFVPQFLQKAFASHWVGDEAFTWVYRKGAEAFNANIKNVGVEGYFYSKDGDLELDEFITEAEGGFARLISKIRVASDISHEDCIKVAQLFAHLEIRTRHIRENFIRTGIPIMDGLMDFISNEKLFGNFVCRKIEEDPSIIEDIFSRELHKQGLPQAMLPMVVNAGKPIIRQALPGIIKQFRKVVEKLRLELPDKIKQASKSGHIRALANNIAPEAKVQKFALLSYKIEKNLSACLPLGDSIMLFEMRGERKFKSFVEEKDNLIAAILPISPQEVLIGSEQDYKIDLFSLPQNIASCSLEYFISNRSSSENERLSKLISQNAYLMTKSDIEDFITKRMKE